MLQGWVIAISALVYIGLLFAVASYGDRASRSLRPSRGRPIIYALSLAIYCTSWTFFGSVGLAAQSGFEFLTIYIGPAILFAAGYPLIRRIIRLAKSERITSVADFIGARYGKSQTVAAVVTIIAVIGSIPYIALQLKAVALSASTLLAPAGMSDGTPGWLVGDIALLVALGMAVFAILFGTRHIDATEHQEGLMLAVATESIVKLVAFLAVGLYVTFGMFDGPRELLRAASAMPEIKKVFASEFDGASWLVLSTLSLFAAILLPRQFHVAVTENNNEQELKWAAWLFPIYLILINLFVLPIAVAGMLRFGGAIDADIFVLALPMTADQTLVTMLAFIGGLSAATAMVIVACVALAIMISNDLVMPLVLRRRFDDGEENLKDMGRFLLYVRRTAIFGTLLLAYAYYRVAGDTAALASIGLLSFAAIAQLAPAFLGGLVWRQANARGAILGMGSGFLVWGYTLLLPTFAESGILPVTLLSEGPFGYGMLRPQALFKIAEDPFINGVCLSLALNVLAYVFGSLSRATEPTERLQANVFLPSDFSPAPTLRLWRTAVTNGDLRETVARYLGEERTDRSFARFSREHDLEIDPLAPAEAQMLRFSEQLLASAIGAASSRLVLSLLVKRRDPASKGAMKLLDDATAAIQYNRDLLQTALDQVRQGISVFDKDLRLICWNRQFRTLLGLPPEYGQVGTPLDAILRYQAERGEFGLASIEALVSERLDALAVRMEPFQERIASTGSVLEVRTNPMPGGGIVTTYTDITDRVLGEQALARANETLERRVRERTEELTRVNEELIRAKATADDANLGKTRFLAAAGHDILQPLNAARLYASSLVERFESGQDYEMVRNVESSLESVEEIIGAVLDISRLDAGNMQPELSAFRLDEILNQLRLEFEPIAREKGLRIKFLPTSLAVRSDRRLLRRLLQNLVSNAIKYTGSGRILVGCRRKGKSVSVEVIDTGIGIPISKRKAIFQEFHRLDDGMRVARGLGLGLSIVERISRVLEHPVLLNSRVAKGSRFTVELPLAAAIPVRMESRPPASAGGSLKGMLVLAIDNEPNILSGMEALLAGWQCQVLAALTPHQAALSIQDQGRVPDILLIDYHLDDANGIDAVTELRWKFGANIAAILITADRTPEVRNEAAARDIHLLNKPVKPAALRAHLARVRNIQRTQADQSAAE